MDSIIDENLIAINEVILAELLPALKIRKQKKLIRLLQKIHTIRLDIQWNEIIEYQTRCLQAGANGIGIPDLIIAQSAIQNGCKVYTLDKHFGLMNQVFNVQLYT